MKLLLRLVAVVGMAGAAACGDSGVAPLESIGKALALVRAKAIPQTVHVIPFYNYAKNGYAIAGTGSVGALIGDENALYGTTLFGGDQNCSTPYNSGSSTGCGIVYRLVPGKNQENYKLDILHTFEAGTADGGAPLAGLLADKSGNLYGTTYYGGAYSGGTLFKLSPTSSGYTETILHSFGDGQDGAYPASGVIEVKGVLYGTTLGGGAYTDKPLCYRYGGSPNGTCGTIYSVNVATGAEQVLHSFGASGDAAIPWATPLDVNGTLYGTTQLGGAIQRRCGTVYSIGIDGSNERVVHNFLNNPTDGCNPFSSLIDYKGLLYGTTCCGGAYYSPARQGTIFSVDISSGTERVLHDFGYKQDGALPVASLVNVQGVFYGTTVTGGTHTCPSGNPCGTIFSYVPSQSSPAYSVIYDFKNGKGGNYPRAGLLYSSGAFYGTTVDGGRNGLGTALKFPQ